MKTVGMNEQWIYGVHAVSALLNKQKGRIKQLVLHQTPRLQPLIDQAQAAKIPIAFVSLVQMNQRFSELTHQGIAAQVKPMPALTEADLPGMLAGITGKALILILDSITDPHNLGACLRTADAAGVDFVLIPKDKSASLNATVAKVASGAAETVPLVRVTNLARAMEQLKEAGIWIYGAAGEATSSLYQMDMKGSIALVMGAEGSGLRRLTREHCDGLFSLPMLGSVESLNVSVATGISLFELVRQRMVGS